jgi:predicted small metal-binding protein
MEADDLNEVVEQIIDRATKLHKQNKEKTND